MKTRFILVLVFCLTISFAFGSLAYPMARPPKDPFIKCTSKIQGICSKPYRNWFGGWAVVGSVKLTPEEQIEYDACVDRKFAECQCEHKGICDA